MAENVERQNSGEHPAEHGEARATDPGLESGALRALGSDEVSLPTVERPPPRRYKREEREGKVHLRCVDQTNVKLYVVRGLTVDEGARKKYPKQTIFLDGVFSGPPFLDNEARQYSLDHHSGCVRAFTLATCEQAVVMLLQGLPVNQGSWHLYINDPDLDAVLAAWILLNQAELTKDPQLMQAVMTLVRVEGVIDVHGLDRTVLTGMPTEMCETEKARIDALLAEERRLKSLELWGQTDLVNYTLGLLSRLDEALLPESYLNDLREIDEVASVPLPGERIAVLCRSKQGIYSVESHLKRRYDRQIAIIVLDRGEKGFTVRQTDAFLEKNLGALYDELNRRDPAVTRQGDKATERWGGSGDIGGSPRSAGSDLKGEEVLQLVQAVFGGGGWWRRMMRRFTIGG